MKKSWTRKGVGGKVSLGASLVVLVVVYGLSLVALVNSAVLGDWMKIGMAGVALVLYLMPWWVKREFGLKISTVLEITYYLFIFAALILGEVFAFYGPFPWWDVVLHALSGFVLAGVGISLVEILGRGRQKRFFTLLFAFCFSVTIGVAWECVEFSFDILARTDAQKDAHVRQISTITLQRDGGNQPVRVNDIVATDIHLASGEVVTIDEGYLDIGLMDTMKDIFVNVAGAGVFCLVGMITIGRGRKEFVENFALARSKLTKEPLKKPERDEKH